MTETATSNDSQTQAGTAIARSTTRSRARRSSSIAVKPPAPGTLRFYGRVGWMVGISLLTLIPRISGGSETYARELVRALARVGRLKYHVFAPTLAPDAIDGLPGTTVTTY